MRLHDTLSGTVKDLPSTTKRIGLYLCGVTVYDSSHIGHARTIIVVDVLRRFLDSKGYKLTVVQNFTDVDDKIIAKSKEKGISTSKLTDGLIEQYYDEFDALNIRRADHYPRATSNIKPMVEMISSLIEKGFAYETKNGVYFSVKKFKNYGALSKKPISSLNARARIEIDRSKKDNLDFALWKRSSESPNWSSPWGNGRPGWHIECSAMATEYMRSKFFIHAGGEDLIFPHHENEIAQSEAYSGTKFADLWIHIGLVGFEREKMSKSLGNVVNLGEAIKRWGPNTIRLFSISSKYRNQIAYSEKSINKALENWLLIENSDAELKSLSYMNNVKIEPLLPDQKRQLRKRAQGLEEEFDIALVDDFDTPRALRSFMKFVRIVNTESLKPTFSISVGNILTPMFQHMSNILGFSFLEDDPDQLVVIRKLVSDRNLMRSKQMYEKADSIRKKLKNMGIELVDHPNRTVWRHVST
ncbi:MAG: cysteine--tRNA ligase [Thaumarchaeota archaeon]|nr:cysteine--tRNA ligase [Nitrososphaerota archaeon]